MSHDCRAGRRKNGCPIGEQPAATTAWRGRGRLRRSNSRRRCAAGRCGVRAARRRTLPVDVEVPRLLDDQPAGQVGILQAPKDGHYDGHQRRVQRQFAGAECFPRPEQANARSQRHERDGQLAVHRADQRAPRMLLDGVARRHVGQLAKCREVDVLWRGSWTRLDRFGLVRGRRGWESRSRRLDCRRAGRCLAIGVNRLGTRLWPRRGLRVARTRTNPLHEPAHVVVDRFLLTLLLGRHHRRSMRRMRGGIGRRNVPRRRRPHRRRPHRRCVHR